MEDIKTIIIIVGKKKDSERYYNNYIKGGTLILEIKLAFINDYGKPQHTTKNNIKSMAVIKSVHAITHTQYDVRQKYDDTRF